MSAAPGASDARSAPREPIRRTVVLDHSWGLSEE
eukprot:CAMPEP_0182901806 /NCGR_PEP_ID=MMETSP0034_2-20130328/29968_1 /TAXON_ID=156128 /ORGANISM="Nephroselmis pyriformis, Strain CCMP717" /LENGTH=33 /DNA_ID= /DNA_START= /DNA_END= /DNA_ORIENTATION=